MTGRLVIPTGSKNSVEGPWGRRLYVWRGRELPSVTSIPKMIGIPGPLHGWMVNNLIEHVLGNASDIALRIATGDGRELEALRRDLRRSTSGDPTARLVGIAVHRAAAEGHRPEQVHQALAPRLRQYLAWLETSGAEVLLAEFQVWSLTHGYAGTSDLLVRFPSGETYLVDLKTGKGLYGEHAIQLMAYSMAEFVGADDVVDDDATGLLQGITGMAILHLQDEGWEWHTLRADPATWEAFCGLLAYAQWMEAHKTIAAVSEGSRKGAAA